MAIVSLSSLFACSERAWKGTIASVRGVTVIQNPERGMWEDGRGDRITLNEDLVIGVEQGDPHKVLPHPVNVVTDSKGEIYIADMFDKCVKKFSKQGDYLLTVGRPGQGPGEFMSPYVMCTDSADNLYVADFGTGRVSIFRADATFLRSFSIGLFVGGLLFGPEGQLIVHAVRDGRIFHTFDPGGHLVSSYGETWEAPEDPRVAAIPTLNFAHVFLGPDRLIYACPTTKPNEMLKYDLTGKLVVKVTRLASAYAPVRFIGDFLSGAFTKGFVVLKDGKMLVCVEFPESPGPSSAREERARRFDLYDEKGRFLISLEAKAKGIPRWVDSQGKLYVVIEEPFPRVVKYSVSFGEP